MDKNIFEIKIFTRHDAKDLPRTRNQTQSPPNSHLHLAGRPFYDTLLSKFSILFYSLLAEKLSL